MLYIYIYMLYIYIYIYIYVYAIYGPVFRVATPPLPPPHMVWSPRTPPAGPRPRASGSWHLRSHPHPEPPQLAPRHPGTPTRRTSQPATNHKPTLTNPKPTLNLSQP